MKKIVIIASTSGSVLLKTLTIEKIRNSILMVISDRECGAIEVAKSFGVDTHILSASSGSEFSDKLVKYFQEQDIDIFISFYTRLFSANFLNQYSNKVYNFHPSLLPACPGQDGFGDTLRSGSKYMGSTLHLVDEGMDTGRPVIQSIHPIMPTLTFEENRHIIFIQQCKIFIQFVLWIQDNRVDNGRVLEANYNFSQFCPNLESSIASNFELLLKVG